MAKNAQEREGREIWKERGGRERGRANVGWNQTRMGVPLRTTRVTHTYCRCTNKRINYPFTRLWPCVCTFTLCLPKAPRMGFWLAPCVYTNHVMVPVSKTEEEEEEEPYLRKMYVCTVPYLSPFVPLYPTYRSCFKEFQPPVFYEIEGFLF